MISLKENVTNEIVIEKSKFITKLLYVNEFEDIPLLLEQVKQEYPMATHYCYAYIFEERKRMSDDGEPSGTAGMPMLNVLEMNSLDHILCVVIRYFGGIKLGTGGLVRAYTKSVTEALLKGEIITLLPGLEVQIEFDYSHTKKIQYLCRNYEIVTKQFLNHVVYTLHIPKDEWEEFHKSVETYITRYQVLDELNIKKEA